MSTPIPQDFVTVLLSEEETITSDTVKVLVDVTKVLTEKTDNARLEILTALKSIIDADWRFSSLSRREDTGMERIEASAYTRVAEKEVANITGKIKAACKKGLELVMKDVQYTPTKKQVEETIEKLRRVIYKKAQVEANALNESTTTAESQKWRVNEVSFGASHLPSVSNVTRGSYNNTVGASAMGAPEEEDSGGLDVTQRVTVMAAVKLARIAFVPRNA